MPNKYFIDSHCHFMNIDDIAIYAYAQRLKLNFGVRLSLLLVPVIPEKTLKKIVLTRFKSFVKFFESDRLDNIIETVKQLQGIQPRSHGMITDLHQRTIIMTPLMMDFEMQVKHEKLWNQAYNLVWKSREAKKHITGNVKILPFLGMDMRRWNGHSLAAVPKKVDNFISAMTGGIKDAQVRKRINTLKNGDIIGIKLYPPLGFHAYPREDATQRRKKYLAVYRHIKDNYDLPITVHCQEYSYKLHKKYITYTNPKNWARLLAEPNMGDLRINLGHFGGTPELQAVLQWARRGNRGHMFSDLKRDNWTYKIIKLLKKYPNTYADVSALDWDEPLTGICFRYLLQLDVNNKLNSFGKYKLEDKLLWGSDYPMILDRFNTYQDMFDSFTKALDFKGADNKGYMLPAAYSIVPNGKDLLERMVHINPKRFLFGV